jgi:hypothetical protein
MSYSDSVRDYCIKHFIASARVRGGETVSIRAGDVHTALAFKNRLPLVCSALGATVFETLANVERLGIAGPSNGANAVFTFRIK